jgi:hypothetical protein
MLDGKKPQELPVVCLPSNVVVLYSVSYIFLDRCLRSVPAIVGLVKVKVKVKVSLCLTN